MKRGLWKTGILAATLILCEQGHGEPKKDQRRQADALDVPAPLRTSIAARISAIGAARADQPQLFAMVDRHLPLFARPLLVPTPRRQGTVAYLEHPLDPALFDRETRRIVKQYPAIFQRLRKAAEEWIAGADGRLQPPERLKAVESTYRHRLEELKAECSCPQGEFLALVNAAGPHNLQGLPPLDPEYLLAWEAVLLREDISWFVKGQVLRIVLRFRDAESAPTLIAVRHMALDSEKKRDGHERSDEVHAASVAREVMTFLLSQPTRVALMELAGIVKQEMEQAPRVQGAVPPDTTLIGLELSRSEEWKQLLDTAAAEKDMGEYVALLREAMRLTAGKKTKGRD